MAKNKNYYIAVTAECELNDGNDITINGFVQLAPGCDMDWLNNTLTDHIAERYGNKPNKVIITSLSQISKGLYDRLMNQEN